MEYFKKIDNYGIYDRPTEGTTAEEKLRDIRVFYYCDKECFMKSPLYIKVPKEKANLIREKLEDYTEHNSNNCVSRCYTWSFISHEVERIIFGY